MIQINLLPVRKIKQREAAKQQLKFFISAFVLLLAILIVIIVIVNGQVNAVQDSITELKAEKKRFAETLKEIDELEKKKAVIEKRTDIIDQLKKTSALTVHVLDEVAKKTPNDRMWLTGLEQSGTGMKLKGMALDNVTVASYLDDLKTSEYISTVTLTSANLKKYAGRNLKEFVLSCTVSMPGSADKEEPETDK